jgi:hypothetical protein
MRHILLISAMAALAACQGHSPASPSEDNIAAEENLVALDMMDSQWGGGPPNQEIALDYYSSLITYAHEYPELRPMIAAAMADDIVTYAEYGDIDAAESKLALKRGAIEAHAGTAPLRKQLKAVLG